MDYDTRLALVILLVGAFILAAIVLLHKPKGKKKREHASRRVERTEPRIEPDLGGQNAAQGAAQNAAQSADDVQSQADVGDETEAGTDDSFEEDHRQAPLLPDDGDDDEPSPSRVEPAFKIAATGAEQRIVTLYLRGRDGKNITGVSVLDAALKAGLQFGEMNIFHRRHEGGTRSVFSMANLVRPGSFDPAAWNLFESPGLTLFMSLPGPVSALDGWDAMLATGQRLAELLDAELLDDTQSQLSRQRVAQMRDEMREYDRKTGL